MLLLLVLTVFLGYEMHKAVGTSVFVMTFSAFCGSAFHILLESILGNSNKTTTLSLSGNFFNIMILCIIFTLIFSLIGSKFATKMKEKTLNIASGIMLLFIAATVAFVQYILPLIRG